MRKLNRPLRLILVAVPILALLLVAVAAALFYSATRRPFPQTSGAISVTGLQAEVNIYRDEFGIPHIYAQNQDDLFFAQGYVHAQDRFWQMEIWRYIGQGRLSEIVGQGGVESDLFIRNVGFHRITADALAMYEAEEPELMAILEAYSAGVNAYIEENRDHLSLNQTILGLVNEPWEIEPWTPFNTLSWGTVMSWDLSGNWRAELQRTVLIQQLGEAMTADLMPSYPANRPVIAPTDWLTTPLPEVEETEEEGSYFDWSQLDTTLIGRPPENGLALGAWPFAGSNSWVVSGDHTASGLPLLANDPHLGIQMPSIWYTMGLHAPGWNVVGFTFAGAPGVVIGYNERIAWGVTTAPVDTQDLFIQRINPNNPHQYEFMGEWRDMELVEEVIKVNGGEVITLEVRLTHHGPILNETREEIRDQLALQWATATPSRLFKAIVLLNQAQGYDDFREATRFWDTAVQNIIYADVEGNIAYQMPGRIPIRQNGAGLTPAPGWTGQYEWAGWIPFEELPAALNPPEGYIITANNASVDADYPHHLSFQWADGNRAQRIVDMLEAALARNGHVTSQDFARIQNDSYSLLAAEYVPLLAGLSSPNPHVQAALERMRGWDLQVTHDSVPAALFEIFFMHLAEATLADELGDAAGDYLTNSAPLIIFFHALAQEPDAHWWNNVNTTHRESREEILLQAVEQTVAWFDEELGGDMNEWRWGRLHTATFVSIPLGQSGIGPIESMVNRGPFPADGGTSTVNANSWRWSAPAAVMGHVSMRMIVDLADPDASLGIHPTGQSGRPYHLHYDDFIEMWLNGAYFPLSLSQEAMQDRIVQRLTLTPAP